MKWIRWWGLIAFVVMAGLISAFWFVFVDAFLKWGIERSATALVGAKVELKEADLTLFPLGLTLTGLQVTNPEEPMRNAVEAARAAMLIDGVNMLRRKIIVEEMSVEGIRLNTPRKYSGAVSKRAARGEEEKRLTERFRFPAFEVPDVKEVLAREDLRSIRLIEETKAGLKEDSARLEGALAGLLDKKKAEEFRARFERIKSAGRDGVGGVLGGTGEFLALQKDIKEELKKAQAVRGDVEKALTEYRARLAEAEAAPLKDIQRIREKYGLTPEGFANMARALLGQRIAGQIDKAILWYRRLTPVVQKAVARKDGVKVERPIRGRGVDVRFPERDPAPDFLVRKANLSASIPAGDITGRISDLTDDQEVLGRPTRFGFNGAGLKGLKLLDLTGELNRVNPAEPKDAVDLKLRGYRVAGFDIAKGGEFPVAIKEALADMDLSALIKGADINASLSAGFSSVDISSGKAGMGALEQAMASALSGVRSFDLKAEVAGTLSDYDLKLSTDLDRVLKGVVGKAASDQAAQFEKSLRAGVFEKAKGPLEELRGGFSGLESIEGELLERTGLADKLLEEINEAALGGVKLPKLPF